MKVHNQNPQKKKNVTFISEVNFFIVIIIIITIIGQLCYCWLQAFAFAFALNRNPPTMSKVRDTLITNNHGGTNNLTQEVDTIT